MLLPYSILPLSKPTRRATELEEAWVEGDLDVLGFESHDVLKGSPSSDTEALLREPLNKRIQIFARWEQAQLQRYLVLARQLPFPLRARLFALVLERGAATWLTAVVSTLTVRETIVLRAHLRSLLHHDAEPIRAAACRCLARAGNLASLASDVAGHARLAGSDGDTVAPGGLTGLSFPYKGGSKTSLQASLASAALRFLADDPAPLRSLVESLLDDPLREDHGRLLELWARAGVTRFHLETYLGGGLVPRSILDLGNLPDSSHNPAVSGKAGPRRELHLLEQERVRRLRALESRCLTLLRSRQHRDDALDQGHLCGAWRWSEALVLELEECGASDLPEVARALATLLERDVSPTLVKRHGLRRAWQLTIETVMKTWIPRGEGLLWGEPDRAY